MSVTNASGTASDQVSITFESATQQVWNIQRNGTNEGYSSVYFTDSNTGWAGGSGGTIIKTTNGGNSWNHQTSGVGTNINSIYFTDSNTGWAVSFFGEILHTTDGGGQ